MRELITELDEHFGIIADLDMLRREFYSMKQGTHGTVSVFWKSGIPTHGATDNIPRKLSLNVMKNKLKREGYMVA